MSAEPPTPRTSQERNTRDLLLRTAEIAAGFLETIDQRPVRAELGADELRWSTSEAEVARAVAAIVEAYGQVR